MLAAAEFGDANVDLPSDQSANYARPIAVLRAIVPVHALGTDQFNGEVQGVWELAQSATEQPVQCPFVTFELVQSERRSLRRIYIFDEYYWASY